MQGFLDVTDQVVHASSKPSSQLLYSPCGKPQGSKEGLYLHHSYQLLRNVTHYLYLSYRWSMQARTWALGTEQHPVITRRRLQGVWLSSFPHPASHVPANRNYPPAGNHASCQLPIQEAGKTWGLNHTGSPYNAFMVAWTSQPFAQVFNFSAVPSTSRAKPKPNSSSIQISCVV